MVKWIQSAGLITFTTQLEPWEHTQPNEVIQFPRLSNMTTFNVEDNFRCRTSSIWNPLKCLFSNQIHDVKWLVHSTIGFAGMKLEKTNWGRRIKCIYHLTSLYAVIIESHFVSASVGVSSTQQIEDQNYLCSLTSSSLSYTGQYITSIN